MDDKKLTPLSPEKSAEFEKRRESDAAAVIQSKCPKCNAWYETAMQDYPFTETFICDCGQYMSFDVPARPGASGIIPVDNLTIVALGDPDARLDTGMTVKEAIASAAQWWESKGRKEMRQQQQRQAKPVGGADHGAGTSFASKNPDNVNFMPSGILNAAPWEALTKREKIQMVKVWHHFYVRNPEIIGNESHLHKMQDRNKVR